jgi:hypothetical protein
VRIVRRSVWLTETGGIRSRGGLKGQARSVKRIFALARANRAIKRIYFYEWRAVRHSPPGLRILVGHRQAPPRLPRAAPRPAPPLNQSTRAGARYRLVGDATLSTRGPWPAEQSGEKSRGSAGRSPMNRPHGPSCGSYRYLASLPACGLCAVTAASWRPSAPRPHIRRNLRATPS